MFSSSTFSTALVPELTLNSTENRISSYFSFDLHLEGSLTALRLDCTGNSAQLLLQLLLPAESEVTDLR
jgi:hypothetical protein